MNELAIWLRSDKVRSFPREVGLNRQVVHGGAFLSYISHCRKDNLDCYASIFSINQIEQNLYDTILFDVDSGLEDFNFVGKVLEHRGYVPRVYFTGRGWHIYVDFEPVVMKDYGERCRAFAEELGISDCIDKKVIGDKRRMARIPGTVNTKTNKLMVLMQVGEISKLGDYLNELKIKSWKNVSVNNDCKCSIITHPNCILNLVEKLAKIKYLNHEERIFLGAYLVNVMPVEKALEIFKCADDFNETSNFQLQWLFDKKYRPYKCKRLIEMKICPMVCIRFPYCLGDVK